MAYRRGKKSGYTVLYSSLLWKTIALIKAKDDSYATGDGMQQAHAFAETLDVPRWEVQQVARRNLLGELGPLPKMGRLFEGPPISRTPISKHANGGTHWHPRFLPRQFNVGDCSLGCTSSKETHSGSVTTD